MIAACAMKVLRRGESPKEVLFCLPSRHSDGGKSKWYGQLAHEVTFEQGAPPVEDGEAAKVSEATPPPDCLQ